MIRVVLPYPLSGNRYWRHVRTPHRTLVIVSDEAREYKRQVAQQCQHAGIREPFLGPVALDIRLHPKLRIRGGASNTVIDLDNGLKVLLDALQGYAYIRDRQIRRLHAEYDEPRDGGGVTVRVEELERD